MYPLLCGPDNEKWERIPIGTYSQLGRDGSGNSLDLLSILVQDESRHSFDLLFLCDLLVDISMVHYPGPELQQFDPCASASVYEGDEIVW